MEYWKYAMEVQLFSQRDMTVKTDEPELPIAPIRLASGRIEVSLYLQQKYPSIRAALLRTSGWGALLPMAKKSRAKNRD